MRVNNIARAFLILLLVAGTAKALTPQQEAEAKDIGDRVYCLCGCVTTLNHCPHPDSECSTKTEMRALINADLEKGKTQPQILQDFVLRYGVKVLAAPPASGFNLAAWIFPGLGLLVGLWIAVAAAKRFRHPVEALKPAPAAPLDSKLLDAVEDEMKKTMG